MGYKLTSILPNTTLCIFLGFVAILAWLHGAASTGWAEFSIVWWLRCSQCCTCEQTTHDTLFCRQPWHLECLDFPPLTVFKGLSCHTPWLTGTEDNVPPWASCIWCPLMPGMRSHLPVALLLLWLPREYLNSALSVTVFVLLCHSPPPPPLRSTSVPSFCA